MSGGTPSTKRQGRPPRSPQVRPRCWFCDEEGVSDEHILAKSLTKLFSPVGFLAHGYKGPDGYSNQIRAKAFAYKTRRFCKDCNNGWMNELDKDVRPSLGAFAINAPLQLSTVTQEQLAFWTTKILFGFLSRAQEGYRFADRGLYRELYERRGPPVGAQVWMGANNHGDIAWSGSHSLTFKDLPDQASRFGATLSFGYGILHLIYHGSTSGYLRLHYDAHRSLRQIWPVQQQLLSWPPPLRMTPTDLTPLAEEINANSSWRKL
jgi:hypothetical protein